MIDREDIYREYQKKVYGYLLKRVNNVTVAEDLCSEVFLKVVNNIDNFDESKSCISTWIYTITRNTLYDYYRTGHESCELDETLCGGEDFVEEICTNEMLEHLADALEALSVREREVIMYRYYYGKTLIEVAAQMNISKSYVLVLQNTALSKLKKYFEI